MTLHGFVDASCKGNDIGIRRANKQAGVRSSLQVQTDEVAAIEGADSAPVCRSGGKDYVIRRPLLPKASLLRGHYIMAMAA